MAPATPARHVARPASRRALVRTALLLLAAFELIVVTVAYEFGATDIALASLAGGVLLVLAAIFLRADATPLPVLMLGVALASFLRAIPQTAGAMDVGDVARYAVPVGYALLAGPRDLARGWAAFGAVVVIALARSYFVPFYYAGGATTLVVANVLGATGAWLWAAATVPSWAPRSTAAAR